MLDKWVHENHLVAENAQLKYILSPGDLVYVPTEEERLEKKYSIKHERIYKFVSSSGTDAFFVPSNVASPILDKKEFSPLNKMGRAITGEMVKEICIPINVDRLGNIKNISL